MGASRKTLKIMSIVAALVGLGFAVSGIILTACGLDGSSAVAGTSMAPVYGVLSGVTALGFVLMGLAGMRAANVPSKAGFARLLAMGCEVLIAANVLFWVWQGFSNLGVLNALMLVLGVASACVCFVFSTKVKAEHEAWH